MTFAFSFFFPFLLVLAAAQSTVGQKMRGSWMTLFLVILAGLIVLIPFRGIALGRWIISLNANFSIPLTALLLSRVWKNTFGVELLDEKACFTAWLFGLFTGLVLYPMALGLGRFDPYSLGWQFSGLFVLLPALTIGLLIIGNRFAYVLMCCILGYDLQLLESVNLWDYLVDPFFALIAAIVLGVRFIQRTCFKSTVSG